MRSLYFGWRGEAKAPVTKEEYERDLKAEKSGKPPNITADQWREAAEARRRWEEDGKTYRLASQVPYYWEEAMYFSDHHFFEPVVPVETEETEKEKEKKARIKAMEAEMTSNLIDAMELFAERGRESGGEV